MHVDSLTHTLLSRFLAAMLKETYTNIWGGGGELLAAFAFEYMIFILDSRGIRWTRERLE